jgi:hypothetical protein
MLVLSYRQRKEIGEKISEVKHKSTNIVTDGELRTEITAQTTFPT